MAFQAVQKPWNFINNLCFGNEMQREVFVYWFNGKKLMPNTVSPKLISYQLFRKKKEMERGLFTNKETS